MLWPKASPLDLDLDFVPGTSFSKMAEKITSIVIKTGDTINAPEVVMCQKF